MGCDIHMYVEHDPWGITADGRRHSWDSFGSRINPGRNYLLFSLLAGVRGNLPPIYEPRGLPENLGYYSRNDARLSIDDEFANEEGGCTRASAASWAAGSYGCKLYKIDKAARSIVETTNIDEAQWVDHPDWHTHSWLTAEEFSAVLDRYLELMPPLLEQEDQELLDYWQKTAPERLEEIRERIGAKKPARERAAAGIVEYRALLAAMKALAADGCPVRVVFWFDN